MKKEELYRYVDHSILKAYARWEDVRNVCGEAGFFRMAAACIPSSFVARAHAYFPELNLCTVVGFPLGNANTASKAAETRQAIADGANEIDMVINIGLVKDRNYPMLEKEVREIRRAAGKHILKVIIETCYLTDEEKIRVCESLSRCGVDFIKTSTGFGKAGARLSDIRLIREHTAPEIQIKAAGGISSVEEMEAFIGAGCTRIGTSRALEILGGYGSFQPGDERI